MILPGADKPIENSYQQTVVEPVGKIILYATQARINPGEDSGGFTLRFNGSAGQTTDKIYEPILYFIIPATTSIKSIEYPEKN